MFRPSFTFLITFLGPRFGKVVARLEESGVEMQPVIS